MATGTGAFSQKRLAFVPNVGTLIQPITKAQFNAWENGENFALPVPKALFSHSDQIEQWQTAVPQGLAQLSGWAGRASDIIHGTYNTGATSMSISFGGNNVFQVGNTTQQFVVTPSGALSFEGNTGGSANNPLSPIGIGVTCALPYQTGRPGADCSSKHVVKFATSGTGPGAKVTAELLALDANGTFPMSAVQDLIWGAS